MRTNREWRRLYFNYLGHYKKKDKDLKARYGKNVHMAQAKLDYWAFRNAYRGTELSRLAEQEEGKRGKSLNVMRDLINEQTYGMSYKQGRKYLRASKKFYKDRIAAELKKDNPDKDILKTLRAEQKALSLNKIRLGIQDTEFIDDLAKAYYQELKFDPDYAGDTKKMAGEVLDTIYGGS